MTLGKFNNAHSKTFKVKFDYQNVRGLFLLTQQQTTGHSVGILNVFMLVSVCVSICSSECVCLWPSTLSVGMHPCNCRGHSMVTPRLPVGSKVIHPRGNQWRQPGLTGLTQQSEHYIELDSPNFTPSPRKGGKNHLIHPNSCINCLNCIM